MEIMNNLQKAQNIVDAACVAADVGNDRCRRFQLKGGEHIESETDLGGWDRRAFVRFIARKLDEMEDDEAAYEVPVCKISVEIRMLASRLPDAGSSSADHLWRWAMSAANALESSGYAKTDARRVLRELRERTDVGRDAK